MEVGDRVRVSSSILVYHHPQHKNQGFDVKGMEGEVIAVVTEWQGRPVSANLPMLVQFENKFKAHFRKTELELL
jgi:hypothetical protein